MFDALIDKLAAHSPRAAGPLLWLRTHRKTRRTLFIAFCHLLGALTSIHAILDVRTSQGAIAWAVSLNTFPYVAVPAYWVFGRSNFEGYAVLRRKVAAELSDAERQLARDLLAMRPTPEAEPASATLLEKLAKLPATRGNHTELLIDGEATFRAIFESIEQAREYVLVQFYIIHDDGLGRRLKDALVAKARAGVRCYVLYDEIGSHDLPASYLNELHTAGVDIRHFNTRKGDANRFQLNFRNHRKIVIVDGRTAFVGGHNVGDEYLGKDPKMGAWRDTHVKVQGPVVQCVQISWIEDWNWAAGTRPTLNWTPAPAPGGEDGIAFCLPSGPADEFETCTLFFLHASRKSFLRAETRKAPRVPSAQATAARADPQRARAILRQRGDAHRAQPIPQSEFVKTHTIEAPQSRARANPQKAVARLHEGVHRVLRKPVLGLPRADHPLGCRRRSVRRFDGAGHQSCGE